MLDASDTLNLAKYRISLDPNQEGAVVIETQKASASLLQSRFKVGYNRAARIIDLLEERGIIGPQNGSKPREVLVRLDREDYQDYDEE